MPIQLGSRVRERMLIGTTIHVGKQQLTFMGQSAGTANYTNSMFGVKQYDFSLLEKCWDELHNREEVVKYYIKKKCLRRRYLSPDEALAYKTLFASRGQHPPDLYAKIGRGKYYASGGPFLKVMCDKRDEFIVKGRGTYINTKIKPWEAKYTGGFVPSSFGPNCPSSIDLYNGYHGTISVPQNLFDGLEALGAKGWNKARPRTSVADLPTFLGELRDLPRMLQTTAKGFHDLWKTVNGRYADRYRSIKQAPKEVSDHFLNHAFGWAPFVSDLIKFHETEQNLNQHIEQMLKDNGQWVKRRHRVEETTDVRDTSQHPGITAAVIPGALHDWCYDMQNGLAGKTTFFTTETVRTWFVGSFKYYIPRPPDNPNTRNYNRVMDWLRIYGVNLSPSVIWNLTPWSWLGDWFGNVGDIIDNVTAQNNDNLTARYAYIMRQRHINYVNDSTIFLHGAGQSGLRCTWSRRVDTKARVEASPFGFGLTGGGIDTPFRAAILTALGISQRVPRRG